MSDLFKEDPVVDQTLDETKDYLSELVGEGKKFTDAAGLAKGKAQSDLHIQKLEAEMRDLRKMVSNQQTIEQFLEKLGTKETTVEPPAPVSPPDNQGKTAFDPKAIEQMLDSKLREKELIRQANVNRDVVLERLKEAWGDNYLQKVATKAKDLGVPTSWFTEMVEKTPQAFLKLMELPEKKSNDVFSAPPRSHSVPHQTNAGVKNYKYWDNLRKTDSRAYWASQSEMHKQALAQGEAFYN